LRAEFEQAARPAAPLSDSLTQGAPMTDDVPQEVLDAYAETDSVSND
jgi:hypothetical protein